MLRDLRKVGLGKVSYHCFPINFDKHSSNLVVEGKLHYWGQLHHTELSHSNTDT